MRSRKINVTPNDLYQQYLNKATMLHNDSRDWGIYVVSYFLPVLAEDLRESIRKYPDFVIIRLSCLQTKSAEVAALNKFYNAAVVSY